MFVNFLDYKLKQKDGQLVEIGKFFPSSKTCSCCDAVVDKLALDIREWNCPSCTTHHDRDGNAALNIRTEGIRILNNGGGNPITADGGRVRPTNRKGKKATSNEVRSLHALRQVSVGSSLRLFLMQQC